jgi:hypothetical protein
MSGVQVFEGDGKPIKDPRPYRVRLTSPRMIHEHWLATDYLYMTPMTAEQFDEHCVTQNESAAAHFTSRESAERVVDEIQGDANRWPSAVAEEVPE